MVSDAMTTARELLIKGLQAMGADGLCYPGVGCGCDLECLAPGGYGCLSLDYCVAAKYFSPENGDPKLIEENEGGYYAPMGEQ